MRTIATEKSSNIVHPDEVAGAAFCHVVRQDHDEVSLGPETATGTRGQTYLGNARAGELGHKCSAESSGSR